MQSLEVNGMDIVSVYETIGKAQKYLQEGNGPIFVEAMTCRFEGHSISDANQYRDTQEMKECKDADPILRLKPRIDAQKAHELEERAIQVVEEAVIFAKLSPEPSLKDLKKHMFTPEGLTHAL